MSAQRLTLEVRLPGPVLPETHTGSELCRYLMQDARKLLDAIGDSDQAEMVSLRDLVTKLEASNIEMSDDPGRIVSSGDCWFC